MKKSLLLILTGSAIMIYACGDKGQSTSETTDQPIEQPVISQDPSIAPASETSPVVTEQQDMIQTQPSPVTTTAPAPVGSAPATAPSANQGPLNPAHGEPGHRCEIPVGAPLSSAPAVAPSSGNVQLPTPSQPNVTQKVELQTDPATGAANTNISAQPATTTTAPGMNPPHGQPGHDCAIPVGSPLKK